MCCGGCQLYKELVRPETVSPLGFSDSSDAAEIQGIVLRRCPLGEEEAWRNAIVAVQRTPETPEIDTQ